MRRNPKLAREARELPEVDEARHLAIDKVTSAHLQVELMGRKQERNMSAEEELIVEEKAMDLMEDAVYFFNKYLKLKKHKYEEKLFATTEKGTELLKNAKEILEERGIQ